MYSRVGMTLSSTYKTGFFFTYSPLAIYMIPSVGFGTLMSIVEYVCMYVPTPPQSDNLLTLHWTRHTGTFHHMHGARLCIVHAWRMAHG